MSGNRKKTSIFPNNEEQIPEVKYADVADDQPLSFEGFARVFFQGRQDQSERQIIPSKVDSSRTYNIDSHIFVTINANEGTLNLYPYRQLDPNKDQKEIPLIINPPIQLKYFVAEMVPQSICGVALYVANGSSSVEQRRHTFRLEFRNDRVLQRYERVSNFLLASDNFAQLSSTYGTAKHYFTSHDEVALARKLELRKIQEASAVYVAEIEGMSREASRLAKRFLKIANQRTISIPQPALPSATKDPSEEKKLRTAPNEEDDASSSLSG